MQHMTAGHTPHSQAHTPCAYQCCRHQISLYVHITKLAFAFETLNQRVQQATISDPAASEIVKVELDSSKETPFEMANRIWDLL